MQPKKNIYIPHFIRKKALRYCIRCEWVFYSVNVNHSWSSRSIKRIVTLYYFLEAFCCLTFHWNKLRPTKKKWNYFLFCKKVFACANFHPNSHIIRIYLDLFFLRLPHRMFSSPLDPHFCTMSTISNCIRHSVQAIAKLRKFYTQVSVQFHKNSELFDGSAINSTKMKMTFPHTHTHKKKMLINCEQIQWPI